MRKTRLLVACFVTACVAVVPAPPASAQDETECPPGWESDFVNDLMRPPASPLDVVEHDGETITIRGDLAVAQTAAVADYYISRTQEFLGCVQQVVDERVTPYRDCLAAASAPILTSPDPVARYVEAGTDLVVRLHYGRAKDDAIALANCNGLAGIGIGD